MNSITGKTVFNGKKFFIEMATNNNGSGLFIAESNGNYRQIIGTCDFNAGKNNKNLKKAIKEKLILMIQSFVNYTINEENIKFRTKFS